MAQVNCTLDSFLCNDTEMALTMPTLAIQRNGTAEDGLDAVIYVSVVLIFYGAAIMVLIGLNMERKRKDYWATMDFYDEYMQRTYVDRLRHKLLEEKLYRLNASKLLTAKAMTDNTTAENTTHIESPAEMTV